MSKVRFLKGIWYALDCARNYDNIDGFRRLQSQEKRPTKGLLSRIAANAQSRSPPKIPSKASKLWNTLTMSRYKARVALM